MFVEKTTCTVVLGGHVNAYSIVKELYRFTDSKIILIDYGKSITRHSNKLTEVFTTDKTEANLLNLLKEIQSKYGNIVLFPTDDLQLELLNSISKDIESFCYIPFSTDLLEQQLDKNSQYKTCEIVGVPYPKTFNLATTHDLSFVFNLQFPIIIKPSTRQDLNSSVFRTLYLDNSEEFEAQTQLLTDYINKGVTFVASEYVPGDDTNIFAYTCFIDKKGDIKNEWIGKKLNQYPDNYGVVASASNEAPEEIRLLGRKIVLGMNCRGIVEPEFKFDARDNSFKLMEVNLRSMMWHRVGHVSGVYLQLSQYNDAIGEPIERYEQDLNIRHHLILMLHEIPNLFSRKGYFKFFINNLFKSDKRHWMVFDIHDIKPFLYSLLILANSVRKLCLKK